MKIKYEGDVPLKKKCARCDEPAVGKAIKDVMRQTMVGKVVIEHLCSWHMMLHEEAAAREKREYHGG